MGVELYCSDKDGQVNTSINEILVAHGVLVVMEDARYKTKVSKECTRTLMRPG